MKTLLFSVLIYLALLTSKSDGLEFPCIEYGIYWFNPSNGIFIDALSTASNSAVLITPQNSKIASDYLTKIDFEQITNWTGVNFNGKELGYVATNHVLTVFYQDETNRFTLKTVASEQAVWRPEIFHFNGYATNSVISPYYSIHPGTNWIEIQGL